MPVSPICEVREGAGPFQSTTDGINITPGATVSIRLASTTDVTDWYLYISGTDETTTPPSLTNVNPLTQKVTSPSTVVTFIMPSAKGASLLFNSTTEGVGGPASATFGLYTLSEGGRRVGSTGEMREGSETHGWVYLVNPIIRQGAAVIWYDDSALPATGSANVQGAITALKTTLRGRAVAATAPADGEVYKWNATLSQWEPGTGGGGSITLGGDLADWIPTPGADHQRVIGLNTIPIPEPDLPVHGDMLQAREPPLLSRSPFDITSDGTGVWVGDIENPWSNASPVYGGLVKVLFGDTFISTRYDYPADPAPAFLPPYDAIQIWSVAYLGGYVYATGLVFAGIGPSTPMLFKFDPNGIMLEAATINHMGYVRTDGTFLYLMLPHPGGSFDPALFWVDPSDLSTQTLIVASGAMFGPQAVGFAYDSNLSKVWLSVEAEGLIHRVDKTTHAVDFTVSGFDYPSGIEYGDGRLWLLGGSVLYGAYTPGTPIYNYPYGYLSALLVLDPTDGSTIQPVTDLDGLILGAIRLAYDAVNNKIWVVCDYSGPYAPEPYGPRLVRVDATTMTVDGWCSLDLQFNMAITVAGGYVWVVDSPAGDPGGGYTILKIDPVLVGYPAPGVPAPGVIARIDSGPIAYEFIKKNQDIVETTTGYGSIQITLEQEVVILSDFGITVWLPATPLDGERHTIKDGSGYAGQYGSIVIQTMDGLVTVLVATIATNGGSVTVIWSSRLGEWSVI